MLLCEGYGMKGELGKTRKSAIYSPGMGDRCLYKSNKWRLASVKMFLKLYGLPDSVIIETQKAESCTLHVAKQLYLYIRTIISQILLG